MQKAILFIHQSSDLYGSDKTLLYLIEGVQKDSSFSIIVVLPCEGPLAFALRDIGILVIISPILKISREIISFNRIWNFIFSIKSNVLELNKKLEGFTISIIHSNTLAVAIGAFYSRKFKIKHVWHVHEIIIRPKIARFVFAKMIDVFSDLIIYNSEATRNFYCSTRSSLNKKAKVIKNGISRNLRTTPLDVIEQIRSNLFKCEGGEIVLALVGRINRTKGHYLLLKEFIKLQSSIANLKLVFIGSAPVGQEYFEEHLRTYISKLGVEGNCIMIPFQVDIWSIWDSIDVAIVPSTEPESFGLVALEAMLSRKPVIAANHGGIKEIVLDRVTGLLFEPTRGDELSERIIELLGTEGMIERLGEAGYNFASNKFSLQEYINSFLKTYKELV